jgi:hypothetical protein
VRLRFDRLTGTVRLPAANLADRLDVGPTFGLRVDGDDDGLVAEAKLDVPLGQMPAQPVALVIGRVRTVLHLAKSLTYQIQPNA